MVRNLTLGGFVGYSAVNCSSSENTPPSHKVSSGLAAARARQRGGEGRGRAAGPRTR